MVSNHQVYEPGTYVKWYKVWIENGELLVLAISRDDAEAAVVQVTGGPVVEIFEEMVTYTDMKIIITEAARGHNMDLITKICRPHRTEV